MEIAKVLEVNHTRNELSPTCQQYVQEVLDVSALLPVPSYVGKSFKQKSIDLVHPLLNTMHAYWLTEFGWDSEVKLRDIVGVSEGLGERLDFARKLPNGKWVAVEVQFGNGGRLEKDFSKMRELHKRGLLEVGILVYFTQETAETADSGLASFEKALQYRRLFDDLPVLVVGLSRNNTPVLDLTELSQIPFPQVMGGKGGKDAKKLHQFLARQIAQGVAICDIELDDASREVVYAQALKHVEDIAQELQQVQERIEGCKDATLQEKLLCVVAQQFKLFKAQVQGHNPPAGAPSTKQTKNVATVPPADIVVVEGSAAKADCTPSTSLAKTTAFASMSTKSAVFPSSPAPALARAHPRTDEPVLTRNTSAAPLEIGTPGVLRIAKPISLPAQPIKRAAALSEAQTMKEKNAQLNARWEAACANRRYHAPAANAMQAAFLRAA